MSNSNLFNFADFSDVQGNEAAAKAAEKLVTETHGNAKKYAEIVDLAAQQGITSLDINQITVVAARLGYDVPTQQTVRNYLNAAVELGLISKPTRLTYGPAGAAVEASEGGVEAGEQPVEEADALAGI